MKKILLVMLVAVILVTALTSCDIVNKMIREEPETEINGETENKEEENTTPEIRYTITEEELNAFLSIKNYTMEINGTLTQIQGLKTFEATLHGWIYQSEVARHEISGPNLPMNCYNVIKDGKSYYFNIGENGEINNLHETEWEPEPFLGHGDSAPISKLSDLTYDEEKKAYCFDFSEESTSATYELYFENGKIVKMIGVAIQETVGADGTEVTIKSEQTMSFSNIGTTVVEVPEFTIQ